MAGGPWGCCRGSRFMLLRVDHYSSLARAIARLDRDSYEARGAIYDRGQRALEKRISSADPPFSQEEIDIEFHAFRDAIRRIEFGDLDQRPIDYQEVTYEDQAPAPRAPARAPEPRLPELNVPEPRVSDTHVSAFA